MCILQLTMGSTRRPLFLTKQPKISNNLSLDAELSNSYSNLNVISFISESLALYRMVNTDVQEKEELLFLGLTLFCFSPSHCTPSSVPFLAFLYIARSPSFQYSRVFAIYYISSFYNELNEWTYKYAYLKHNSSFAL